MKRTGLILAIWAGLPLIVLGFFRLAERVKWVGPAAAWGIIALMWLILVWLIVEAMVSEWPKDRW